MALAVHEFLNRGRGPGAVCPFTHTLCFYSERIKYTLSTLLVDYNKVSACYAVEIFKNKPLENFKQGGARPVRRRWIRLCMVPRQL